NLSKRGEQMREILEAFSEHGLNPGELVLDGKVHRFKVSSDDDKKSGWYVGHNNYTTKSGELYEHVTFGNFRTGEKIQYLKDNIHLKKEDRNLIKVQNEAAKRKEEKIRETLWEENARSAERVFNSLLTSGHSNYLKIK